MPIVLPRIAAPVTGIALWNALMTHAGAPLALPGGRAQLSFARSETPPGAALAARIATKAGEAVLAVPKTYPFRALHGVDLAVEALGEVPPSLAEALVEGMVASLLALLPQGFLPNDPIGSIGTLAHMQPSASEPGFEWFDVTIEGLADTPAVIAVGGRMMELVGSLFAKGLVPQPVANGLSALVPVAAAVTLGFVDLTLEELAGLAPGDVMVLSAGAARTVRAAGRLYRLEEGENGAVITAIEAHRGGSARRNGVEAMAAETHEETAPQQRLGGLPVRVDVDLASFEVSLAELESWRSGSIVALPGPAPEAGVGVTLSVGGRMVASGDLVRIDDRLAVRLTRLSSAG